mmetsp:Transcript_22809/g.73105  ORF Transcript_22809/g.73105 Transcript_22809/m.73105 type:complete len:591 (+) Transcript_22809:1-1773(+)
MRLNTKLFTSTVKSGIKAGGTLLRKPPPPAGCPRNGPATGGGKASDKVRSKLYQLRQLESKGSEIGDRLQQLSTQFGKSRGEATEQRKSKNDHTVVDGGMCVDRIEVAREAGDTLKAAAPALSSQNGDASDQLASMAKARASLSEPYLEEVPQNEDSMQPAVPRISLDAVRKAQQQAQGKKGGMPKTSRAKQSSRLFKNETAKTARPSLRGSARSNSASQGRASVHPGYFERDVEVSDLLGNIDIPRIGSLDLGANLSWMDPEAKSEGEAEEAAASESQATRAAHDCDGDRAGNAFVKPDDQLSADAQSGFAEWRVVYTEEGDQYFYCDTTGESSWDDPRGIVDEESAVLHGETWVEQWYRRATVAENGLLENNFADSTVAEQCDTSDEVVAEPFYDARQEVDHTALGAWSESSRKSTARSSYVSKSPRWTAQDLQKLEDQGYLASARSIRSEVGTLPSTYSSAYGVGGEQNGPGSPVPPLNLAQVGQGRSLHGGFGLYEGASMHQPPYVQQQPYKTPRELELEELLRQQTARAEWLEHEAFQSREAEKAAALRAKVTAATQHDLVHRAVEEERQRSVLSGSGFVYEEQY